MLRLLFLLARALTSNPGLLDDFETSCLSRSNRHVELDFIPDIYPPENEHTLPGEQELQFSAISRKHRMTFARPRILEKRFCKLFLHTLPEFNMRTKSPVTVVNFSFSNSPRLAIFIHRQEKKTPQRNSWVLCPPFLKAYQNSPPPKKTTLSPNCHASNTQHPPSPCWPLANNFRHLAEKKENSTSSTQRVPQNWHLG